MPLQGYEHSRELLRLLPNVLRAREFHLYLEGGRRIVDLWLAGGKAVLGHKTPRVLLEMKNAAERGLFTAFPHPTERRFIKALRQIFPDRAFRLYNEESALYRALEKKGIGGLIHDPAFPRESIEDSQTSESKEAGQNRISLWRPFIDDNYLSTILAPVLPWPLSPAVLVLDKGMDSSFPPGELIPPVILAPAARALYDLTAVVKAFSTKPVREPKIEKAIKDSLWRRRGIYLTIKQDTGEAEYAALFKHFLEGGFLIPPSKREPVILPREMSKGEEAKLAELLQNP